MPRGLVVGLYEVDTCSWGGALHTLSHNQPCNSCNLGKVGMVCGHTDSLRCMDVGPPPFKVHKGGTA